MRRLIICACLLLFASQAAAQNTPSAGSSTGEIIVEGTRDTLQQELRQLLDTRGDQIARFEMAFCPLIMGFDTQYTEVLLQRLRVNAQVAGLQLADQECEPNAVIIFIEQPHDLVQAFRTRMPQIYRGMSAYDVRRLTEDVRPFYVWHGIGRVGRYGERLYETISTTFMASRLRRLRTFDIEKAFLVIDVNRTVGMTLGQIGDFASLQLMLDLRLAAKDRTRPGSLLTLFDQEDPAAAPLAMSAFDTALLRGVYGPGRANRSALQQRRAIAQEILEGHAAGPER